MILFFKVFLTEFIAEMGDKTQLMLIALTSKYKLRDIILGTAAAILVLNGLAVLAGGHQHLRAMMTRKRRAAADPGSGSHRLRCSLPFS